jgi:hypothetical protein
MCEFDGSNQPCTTRYHNIFHKLPCYCYNCMQFMANYDLNQKKKKNHFFVKLLLHDNLNFINR